MKDEIYLVYHNNAFGTRMKDCYSGSFNLSKEDDTIYIHIYYEGKEVIKLLCYKNPYYIALGILGAKNPLLEVKLIKEYQAGGLVEGKDFTITENGVWRKNNFDTNKS